MIPDPCSCGGLQLSICLLEVKYRGEETVQVSHLVEEGEAMDMSVWTSVKPLTPIPTQFSWRN